MKSLDFKKHKFCPSIYYQMTVSQTTKVQNLAVYVRCKVGWDNLVLFINLTMFFRLFVYLIKIQPLHNLGWTQY
jgi:hypothetical protein